LGVSKSTVQNFIELFESTHLLYRLPPFGYGKEVLRARYKLYLADAAISSAVLMKGKTILEHADALGRCVKTCVFAHFSSHSSLNNARFSYWQNTKTKEVDLIVEFGDQLVPFEVKYQSQSVSQDDIPALIEFCRKKTTANTGYILTKAPQDIGPLKGSSARLMRIPASLLCYWIGEAELSQKNLLYCDRPRT
jgi:predicted AAA+ superfamily ATPase